MAITFLSIKAKGMNHPAKRRSLWKEAIHQKCDILCVQETNFCTLSPPTCSHPKCPHQFNTNAVLKSKGVMIAIKDFLTFKLHTAITDPQGRFLIIVCDIYSTTNTVANVYAPNKGQMTFFHRIMKKKSIYKERSSATVWGL